MKRITKIEPAKAEEKKLRVAAYCRVSTGSDEQLESLKTQKAHYQAYIHKHSEWEFAGIYYDEGITGTKKDKRPELLHLLRDCELGKVDFVLTKSISRFSRNTTDCLEMVRKLLSCGVGIYFEKENLNTQTMEDEFLLTVLGSLAESESRSISDNERWSVKNRFLNGTFHQGMAPYGYKLDDGNLVIDEERAPVVRLVFERALAGDGSSKIAVTLNEKKIPSPLNGKWSSGTVKGILTNERYVGDALYQKTYSDENFVRHTNHGERDQYLHQDHHEPIISREDFQKAQDMLAQHRKEKNIELEGERYQNRHLFTGKIICGECGCTMKHRLISGRVEGSYEAWVCGRHIQSKELCSMKAIQQQAIEAAFTTMLNKLIFSRKELFEPFVEDLRNTDASDITRQIEEIDAEMEENMSQVRTITDLAASGLLDSVMLQKTQSELSAKRMELTSRKAMLAAQLSENYKGTAEAGKLLKELSRLEISRDFNPDAFETFVKKVHIYSRQLIGFELTCGLIFKEEVKVE